MAEQTTRLPSGLYVVEAQPEAQPQAAPEAVPEPPPDPAASCRGCGEPAPDDPRAYYGPGMWHHAHPACGHPRYFLCPACSRLPGAWRCGVCGGGEFYT